jgi:hypothetical protein
MVETRVSIWVKTLRTELCLSYEQFNKSTNG